MFTIWTGSLFSYFSSKAGEMFILVGAWPCERSLFFKYSLQISLLFLETWTVVTAYFSSQLEKMFKLPFRSEINSCLSVYGNRFSLELQPMTFIFLWHLLRSRGLLLLEGVNTDGAQLNSCPLSSTIIIMHDVWLILLRALGMKNLAALCCLSFRGT